MRQNWLSNRIFKSFDDIVDHCCYAWNMLIDQPWKIMSIARRDWAIVGQPICKEARDLIAKALVGAISAKCMVSASSRPRTSTTQLRRKLQQTILDHEPTLGHRKKLPARE